PAQLHRPAGGDAVHLPDLDGGRPGAATCGPAALHRQREVELGAARRPDAHRAGQGVAGGQLQPGRRQQGDVGGGERELISRVAEHGDGMSRYLERAESMARVLDVNQILLLDLDVPLEQRWRPVLIISGVYDMPGEPEAEAVQSYMTWETDNLSSIAA